MSHTSDHAQLRSDYRYIFPVKLQMTVCLHTASPPLLSTACGRCWSGNAGGQNVALVETADSFIFVFRGSQDKQDFITDLFAINPEPYDTNVTKVGEVPSRADLAFWPRLAGGSRSVALHSECSCHRPSMCVLS